MMQISWLEIQVEQAWKDESGQAGRLVTSSVSKRAWNRILEHETFQWTPDHWQQLPAALSIVMRSGSK